MPRNLIKRIESSGQARTGQSSNEGNLIKRIERQLSSLSLEIHLCLESHKENWKWINKYTNSRNKIFESHKENWKC